ncbi:formyl peptide receptor 2-like [Anomaloglossus baeobatrachus]|uniref:formyl peptide receptor 2-like n=1 Tax=Anomaloglossus baeobatrachus TaxID=238106 RepID=UPI003F508921
MELPGWKDLEAQCELISLIFILSCLLRFIYEDYESNTINYNKLEVILQKASITLYTIIFALGNIGNGLVIWIAGFRMKKTISAVWFLHLAIADFLCCASLTLRIAEWVLYFDWLPVDICIMSLILFNLNMTTSVLLLTAMSVDRWVSIMWPFWGKVHRTCKTVRITAAIIWMISFLSTGLVYYLYIYYIHDLNEWCTYVHMYEDVNHRKIKQTLQIIRLFIMCVTPFLIIAATYVTIFFKLRKSKRSQRPQRSSRIITAVILCFFICWFPYYIWPLTPMYEGHYIQFYILNTITMVLAYLNSCINPIIYVFMGQDFQQIFLRSIPFRIEKALNERSDDHLRQQGDREHNHITHV